jgi:hypothetical protein
MRGREFHSHQLSLHNLDFLGIISDIRGIRFSDNKANILDVIGNWSVFQPKTDVSDKCEREHNQWATFFVSSVTLFFPLKISFH